MTTKQIDIEATQKLLRKGYKSLLKAKAKAESEGRQYNPRFQTLLNVLYPLDDLSYAVHFNGYKMTKAEEWAWGLEMNYRKYDATVESAFAVCEALAKFNY